MSRTTVTFNGHDLTASYHVSNMRVSLLPREVSSVTVPGMDGAMYAGSRLQAKDITLTLTAMGTSLAERQEAARTLAGILAVKEPKPLAISVDGGLYYLAIPTSDTERTIYRNATSFEVTFRALDPVMYGIEKTITLSSSTAKTVTIGGTYPTYPVIESGNARGASSSNKYVRITNTSTGEYMDIPVSSSGTHTVVADCQERSCKVDGATAAITLLSDWMVLNPGTVTLQRTSGSGTFTITYKERWL